MKRRWNRRGDRRAAEHQSAGSTSRRPPIQSVVKRKENFARLMILPSIVFLVAIFAFPLIALIGMSTFELRLTDPSATGWIGLGNFERMMHDERFWASLQRTVIYTVSTVLLQVVIGMGLALALSRAMNSLLQRILRTVVLLSMIIAPVVVGLVWRTLLLTQEYGLVDYFAMLLGFGSVPWLANPTLALVSVIAIHTWQWTPFAFLVFSGSLAAVPRDLYDASAIDRANSVQQFVYITLPILRPAIIVVVIIRLMVAMRAFAAIFSATGGGPGTATEILNLYGYRVAFTSLNIGYGAALATVLLIITTVASYLLFRIRGTE